MISKEQYLLICLIEECAEVQKAATKALRLGLRDRNPSSCNTNASDIASELADIETIRLELLKLLSIPSLDIEDQVETKLIKLNKYIDISSELGVVDKGDSHV